MKEVDRLATSAKSTWHMLGMMIFTFGFYQLLWVMKNRLTFNNISRGEVSEWNVYVLTGVFAWTIVLQQSAPTADEDLAMAMIITLIGFCLQLAQAIMVYFFVTSKIIFGLSEEVRGDVRNASITFNKFFAFLFQSLYINFKLNQIKKLRAVSGADEVREGNVIRDTPRRYFISTGPEPDASSEVSERELYALYKNGSIIGETLIWTEGWDEWRTCDSMFGK